LEAVISQAELADGEMIAREVNGVDVLLCRVDGEYYAVANRCSHGQQMLATGKLKGYEVNCPLHGARFDVRDGRCMAAPAVRPIKSFPVTLQGGKVNVTVSDDDQPARPRFGPVV
jgi:nitrite reductase/ring-hydroxylating ferredoxin subunit